MIIGKGLRYTYSGGSEIKFPDFQFEQGSQWLILGNSGSGKTTLLQLLAGLRKPSGGTIEVNQKALEKLSGQELNAYRGKDIGIVFQQAHFVESLSVIDNLILAQYLAGKPQEHSAALKLLQWVNLEEKANRLPRALSQGERQRVSMLRAVIKSPSVILADEPSSALDDANTGRVVQLLQKQAEAAKATLIIVTHDQRLKDIFPQRIELA